jgi:hypothetical protein
VHRSLGMDFEAVVCGSNFVTLVAWQQPANRVSLGDMGPVQTAPRSQGSVEPESAMAIHEIHKAAREEPHRVNMVANPRIVSVRWQWWHGDKSDRD